MLIQKKIEDNIALAIEAALLEANVSNVQVGRTWKTQAKGLVKWIDDENPSTSVYVSVSLSGPEWRSYSLTEATLSANVTMFVRTELDPQGEQMEKVAEVIEKLMRDWVTTDITTQGLDADDFSVDAFSSSASTSPVVRSGICSITWTPTISGSYREPQPTQTETQE